MKKSLSILIVLFLSLVFIPFNNVNAAEKVKVYMFEAGGCPYCEAEEKYLKSLSSYGVKFELIKKELYVDHVDWEPGKDYELGKAVAETFKSAGFTDAAYTATPFVVISDIYAAATYSENLEEVIEAAYQKGDEDVVGCIASGKSNCLKISTSSNSSVGTILVTIVCAFIILVTYVVKSNNDKEEILNAISKKK